MTKDEIIKYLSNEKEKFSSKYQISNLILFGSYARDENLQSSDIDIAIDTDLSDYFLLYDFKEDLEKKFNKKVDIVRLREQMNPYLKKRILKDGIYV
jgi:predicted nucleotidyltransferase